MAAAWLVSGCKDNPGFALLPDPPAEETSSDSTSVEPATTTTGTIGHTSTTEDPPTTVTEGSTSTTEPPDTTDTTMGPSQCGDGEMDPGEECDDGNDKPHDGCEANCRRLFDEEVKLSIDEQCASLVAADFNGDALLDLAVATTIKVRVLENLNSFVFSDQGHSFGHGGVVPDVMFARNFDDKPLPDLLVLGAIIYVCHNLEPDAGNYCENGTEQPFLTPMFTIKSDILQIADATGDQKADAIFVNDSSDKIGIFPGNEGASVFGELIQRPMPDQVQGMVTAIAPAHIGGTPALDLVVAHVLENPADGYVSVVLDFADVNAPADPVLVGKALPSLAVADLGLAGDLPNIIAAGELDKRLYVLGGTANNGYAVQGAGILSGPQPRHVLAAPLRGAGTWDLITFDFQGPNIRIAPADGFLPPNAVMYAVDAPEIVDVDLVDLDNDNDLDVVALDRSCNISILPNLTEVQ